ncbi:antitoxin VbhA family protein [Aureimonas sp. AU12]|uniref:antitoxin VbhA family protein n=1 Tax=Aureimonas sp. AU12 TaxID=1638161 RepID=UPI0007807EA9|nr:antitoxin VbhA family protein [Aureimonas sp. AU12]
MSLNDKTTEVSEAERAERARRQKASDLARAANVRQGYVHDPKQEEGMARWAAGEITMEELRQETIARYKRI